MNIQEEGLNFVFIQGIMPRSGTHYLMHLLCLHQKCRRSVLVEDGLLARSSLLMKYIERSNRQWVVDADLPEDMEAEQLLAEGLGEGLRIFLKRLTQQALDQKKIPVTETCDMDYRYMVTKTPNVSNLKNFFRLFPDEKLIILIRDGRSLVESINLSFKYNREAATRDWANAARDIFEIQKQWTVEGKQFLVIKYEELYANTENEMRKILSFLDLDTARYDFEKALNSPVIGSSVFKRGAGPVHWEPVDKTAEFNPLQRSAKWNRKQHERFNWLAGKELIMWGYDPIKPGRIKFLWVLTNYFYDWGYALKIWFWRFIRLNQFIGRKLKAYLKNDGVKT
ncbi:sulfotransferase family protein [Mucilaginibacter ginsenosidivorans]|nr:sulfotransferase [Mucilaginibacter ginsenosidivorans]